MGSAVKKAAPVAAVALGPAALLASDTKLGNRIGQAVGLKGPKEQFGAELNDAAAMLKAAASGQNPMAQQQYQQMAKQGLANTLATINSQRPLQASERANLAARAGADMQMQAAEKGSLMGLEEQAQARNALADLLLKRSVGMQSAEQESGKRLAGLLGSGMSAAGTAFGGKP